jgi:hypothetical protein
VSPDSAKTGEDTGAGAIEDAIGGHLVFKTHEIRSDDDFTAAEVPPAAEFNFYEWLERRFEQERKLTWQAVGEALAEMLHDQRKQAKQEIADEIRQLRIETTQLETTVQLLRAAMAESGKPVDPPLFSRSRAN